MSPRSILKQRSSSSGTASTSTHTHPHAVHFPPSPSLCRTFAAHPPQIYDRTPIVVDKNSCALPERGGRTYVLDTDYRSSTMRQNAHYRSVDSEHTSRSLANLPPLVPDLSSESDESDGFVPSPQMPPHMYAYGAHGLPTKYETYDYAPCTGNNDINALAFLPYPPSPPANYSCNTTTPEQQQMPSKPRKQRSESRRRHDGATDPDRISKRREYLRTSQYAGFVAADDGCLGGF